MYICMYVYIYIYIYTHRHRYRRPPEDSRPDLGGSMDSDL